MKEKTNKNIYIMAILYIVLGLILCIFPSLTANVICYILAGIAVVVGIINLVIYFKKDVVDTVYRYDFVNGVMFIVIGVILFIKASLVLTLIPMLMGILILGNGVVKMQHAIDLKRFDFSGWIYVLIISLLCLSVGFLLVLQPQFIINAIIVILGVSFIFCGVTDLITFFMLSKQAKNYEKNTVDSTEEAKKEEVVDSSVVEE